MTPLLEVRDLSVCFGGEVEALRGVSFTLERGDSLAVVGETGSGKSTMAACLAGLVQPPEAAGSVRLDGQELLGADPEALRLARWEKVAIALQGAPFNPVSTVGTQVAEPIRDRRRAGADEALGRARELASEVLLDPALLDRYPHQLSGGQRQRVMIAMALAQETPVLVLDEPTTFLDLAAQIDLLDLAHTLNREEGRTVVMVLHDLNMAARYADHLIAMRAGTIMATGSPAEVITEDMLREVFEIEATVMTDPVTGAPMVLPERALTTDSAEITPETPIDELVLDAPPELVVA